MEVNLTNIEIITEPVYFVRGWYKTFINGVDREFFTNYISDFDMSGIYSIAVISERGLSDFPSCLGKCRIFNGGVGLDDGSNQFVLNVPLYTHVANFSMLHGKKCPYDHIWLNPRSYGEKYYEPGEMDTNYRQICIIPDDGEGGRDD